MSCSRDLGWLEGFRGFAQSLQANGCILIRLDHEDFLCNPLRFAVQPSVIRRCTDVIK
jgi:hypothetical protein